MSSGLARISQFEPRWDRSRAAALRDLFEGRVADAGRGVSGGFEQEAGFAKLGPLRRLPRLCRPIPDLGQALGMLHPQPAYRPFAARAKSGDVRAHSLRDFADLSGCVSKVRCRTVAVYLPKTTVTRRLAMMGT